MGRVGGDPARSAADCRGRSTRDPFARRWPRALSHPLVERGEEACALLADALAILRAADESSPPSYDLRLSAAKLLMEVGQPNEAAELLQGLRLEHDDQLEAWYLLACAAMQAGDAGLALEEARSALAFAASDACPPEEREWMAQLEELVQEAAEAAGEEA